MVESQPRPFLEFFVTRKEATFIKAHYQPTGIEIDFNMSFLKFTTPRLDSSDFEVGDKLCVEIDPQNKILNFSHNFISVDVRKDSTDLYILTEKCNPTVIPLSVISTFSAKISDKGRLEIFQRDGKVRILKAGLYIFRLGQSDPLPPKVKFLYITYINGTKISASENLTSTGFLENIQLSSLKSYNQPWTVSDLTNGDIIKAKYDAQNRLLSYKLVLSPTEVKINGSRYYFTIREYGIKEITKDRLGDAASFIKADMIGLKVLHSRGEIRVFLHRKNLIRLLRETNLYIPIVPEIKKLPEDRMAVNIKPLSLQNIEELKQQSCEDQYVKHIKPSSNYSFKSDGSSSKASSLSALSNMAIGINDLNQNIALSDANKRIHIAKVRTHFNMPDPKFTEISSVLNSGRVFMKESAAYLKAIGVGFLDHLCRKSTHPNILKQFITNLESRSGLYLSRIQPEESRNLLINMLKMLETTRSIKSLEKYYKNSDFMGAYISEIKNLTFNKMGLEGVSPDLMSSFCTTNKEKPNEVLRYIGSALGIIIFTHSLHCIKPISNKCQYYSFVLNLLLKGPYSACLLYYKYQNKKDALPTKVYKYQCKKCGQLPHIKYFSKIDGKLCQECHQSEFRNTLNNRDQPLPYNIPKNQEGSKPPHNNPAEKGQKDKKQQKCRDNTKNINKLNPPIPSVPTLYIPPEPITSTHPCDGCKDSIPLNQLQVYCSAQHFLCEKCSIISSRKEICVTCDLIRAQVPSKIPLQPCNKCQKLIIKPYLIDLGCHKVCKKCILDYFDSKLNRRQTDFGCLLGCYHKFSLEDLRKMMKPSQFNKLQEIGPGGESKPEVSRCPGCPNKYNSISHDPSFFCKRCNTIFCGFCGKITSIQGQHLKEMHDSSCRLLIFKI